MSSDVQLQEAVLEELKWEPSVVASHIGVTAKAGIVTLSGHVESFMERHNAEDAAGRVKGVKGIAEEIEVRLPFDKRREDDDIATAALERFIWNALIPNDSVKVKVEKGYVTLTGEVDWNYQREAAENDVRSLHGVTDVFNKISLKTHEDATDGIDKIVKALDRSWFFDPESVQVTSKNGKIKLTGNVRSWHDRRVVEKTAWASPWTLSVENDIKVI